MKKIIILLVSTLFLSGRLQSQQIKAAVQAEASKAMNNAVAIGISIPVDVFKQTHHAGFTADYSWGKGRFSRDSNIHSLLKFVLNGGLSYYPGKKAASVGYEFEYSNYLNIHAMAGIDFKPSTPLHITLFSGPVISIYKNNSDAGIGVNLYSSYYITNTISLGPGLAYRKFAKTNALWAGAFRASYSF